MRLFLFEFLLHLIFIYISFQLLIRYVRWEHFLKVSGENQKAIRLLIIFLAIALGTNVSGFIIELFRLSSNMILGSF